MNTVTVKHTVEDFDAWKSGYDAHEDVRRKHGCTGATVSRSGNDVLVIMTFADQAGAEGFLSDPGLKEKMAEAGVVGAPDIAITEQVEQLDYAGANA